MVKNACKSKKKAYKEIQKGNYDGTQQDIMWIAFLVGLILGALLGAAILGLVTAGKDFYDGELQGCIGLQATNTLIMKIY